jgi:glucose uptake protein GlcU
MTPQMIIGLWILALLLVGVYMAYTANRDAKKWKEK